MCCSVGFARSLGLALLPLALCCIVANLLLLFPMGEITYIKQDRLASYIWYFGGLGGGGLLMLVPAVAFTTLGKCSCCWNESLMVRDVYLLQPETWTRCLQPVNIIEWNITLLCVLLGLAVLEFIICLLQLGNGLVNAVCRPCCYKQEYSLNA
ncbi:transmembrane 4 L6 family member 18 [Neolamprologus brichardi]|uniref:transmembrane 4 L6 family member 18 n=1 Tax=Neolamprologus brichardi TaxID=32507 RepID=UPI001643B1BA|nr:transmembrane 4 L6 family member 18 [Neolamprologus brichardi]